MVDKSTSIFARNLRTSSIFFLYCKKVRATVSFHRYFEIAFDFFVHVYITESRHNGAELRRLPAFIIIMTIITYLLNSIYIYIYIFFFFFFF